MREGTREREREREREQPAKEGNIGADEDKER